MLKTAEDRWRPKRPLLGT